MNGFRTAAVAAALALWTAGAAQAQPQVRYYEQPEVSGSVDAVPVSHNYACDDGACGAGPGHYAPVCDSCGGCNGGCGDCGYDCGGCGCCRECGWGPKDPWTAFPEFENGWTFGGWISAGVWGNENGTEFNCPVAFLDVSDFTVNQVWFYSEKVADTSGGGWDWGFRADFVWGADGPDTQAFGGVGFDNEWDSSNDGVYGSALPQLYGVVAYNDLSVKLGHFYTIIGYEVVTAPDNFFTSHAYTMNFGEPFTHTGALAEYAWNDNITLYGGWTLGWDTGFEEVAGGGGDTFLGGVSMDFTEDTSFTWAVTAGDFGNVLGDIYMNSFVIQTALTDRLTYVFQHDLGNQSDIPGQALDNEWYGINQYLFWKLNECWTFGARVEWFRDDDGARVTANNFTGAAGDYVATTVGFNWKPHANITVRPELRYDDFDGVADAGGNLPFNNGQDAHQFGGGFDIIFTY